MERETTVAPTAVLDNPEDGLADLYRSHHAHLVKVAYGVLGSAAAAEDAVQDAYVEVCRRWGSVDNPSAYLRRAVVNRATSIIRRRIVEQRHARAAPDAAAENYDELRDAVMKLPVKYRDAVVLRFYEDLPDEQIGAALGVKRATVRSLVHRGVEQLRDAVG